MYQKLKKYIIRLDNFYKKHEIKFLIFFIVSFSLMAISNTLNYEISDWEWHYYLYVAIVIIDSITLFKLLKKKYKK